MRSSKRFKRRWPVAIAAAVCMALAACTSSPVPSARPSPARTPSASSPTASPSATTQPVATAQDGIDLITLTQGFTNLTQQQFALIGRFTVPGQVQVVELSLNGEKLPGVSLSDLEAYYRAAIKFAGGQQAASVTLKGTGIGPELSQLEYRVAPAADYPAHYVLVTAGKQYVNLLVSPVVPNKIKDAVTEPLTGSVPGAPPSTLTVINNKITPTIKLQRLAAVEACQATVSVQITSGAAALIRRAARSAGAQLGAGLATLNEHPVAVGQEGVCISFGLAVVYARAGRTWASYASEVKFLLVGQNGLTWWWLMSSQQYGMLAKA